MQQLDIIWFTVWPPKNLQQLGAVKRSPVTSVSRLRGLHEPVKYIRERPNSSYYEGIGAYRPELLCFFFVTTFLHN